MIDILRSSWALFLGLFLLMIGNGLQGSLLGLRGALEGFDATTMSWVMSAYFLGFLGGSRLTPVMIGRVGHVRVFAALASLISAAFILYAALPNPWLWAAMRLLVGFCFSGVYVVTESWLNASASNENRGKALSVYLIVQMGGIITAQGMLNLADPGAYALFVLISVLVSVSFAPILLSVSPAPVFETAQPMSLIQLYRASPLGVVGATLLGGIYSAMFGMSAVYATEKGLTIAETSVMIALMYVGGLVFQYPIGWLSDRMDRRLLIVGLTGFGAAATLIVLLLPVSVMVIYFAGMVLGGVANPLYSLMIAHTNDFLKREEMAAAAGGLMFYNGLGATGAPLLLGWLMTTLGADSFFGFTAALMGVVAAYGLWRMTRRPSTAAEETQPFAPVGFSTSPVAMELAQEVAIERAMEEDDATDRDRAA